MKAILQETYGPPDVLQVREVDKPVMGDHDVLLRVHAAGVDPSVWHFTTGVPYAIRMMGGVRKPTPRILGWDVAGRVEAVGKDTGHFKPNDEVFGTCNGSFAEFACTREDRLVPKPAMLTFEQAAAIPVSGTTALQALRDKGEVKAGQRVLILGAGGGIGTFAVQIAKAFGAEVTGVCSTTKTDLVRSIGADHVIDHTREDFCDGRSHYDVILDPVGSRSLSDLRRALAREGIVVLIGGEGGGRWFGRMDRFLHAYMLGPFLRQKMRPMFASARKSDLLFLKELVDAKKLVPVVDRTFSLSEVPKAVQYLSEGRARGKVVISTCAT